jgi:hypothetical protein
MPTSSSPSWQNTSRTADTRRLRSHHLDDPDERVVEKAERAKKERKPRGQGGVAGLPFMKRNFLLVTYRIRLYPLYTIYYYLLIYAARGELLFVSLYWMDEGRISNRHTGMRLFVPFTSIDQVGHVRYHC